MKRQNFGEIFFFFILFFAICLLGTNAFAGQLNGFVFHTGGTTLIIGENSIGQFITTDPDPCSPSANWMPGGGLGTDGHFSTTGLPNGAYYVKSLSYSPSSNYITEYWAGPLSESVRDCNAAVPAVIIGGGAINNIRFELDEGASVSGTVYREDGTTPLINENNIRVDFYSGNPCDYNYVDGWWIDSSDGSYTRWGLAPGTYYLKTSTNSSDNEIVDEWWAESGSVDDCSMAESITITEANSIINKNFQLNFQRTISGTVYNKKNGLPLTGIEDVKVIAFDDEFDPCLFPVFLGSTTVNPTDGTYTFKKVPVGSYYLGITFTNNAEITGWSNGTTSDSHCSKAKLIVITEDVSVADKDFIIANPLTSTLWNIFLPAIINSIPQKR